MTAKAAGAGVANGDLDPVFAHFCSISRLETPDTGIIAITGRGCHRYLNGIGVANVKYMIIILVLGFYTFLQIELNVR